MPVPMPPKNDKNKNNKGNKGTNWGRLSKTLSFWILVIMIPVALVQLSGARADAAPEISYTQYKALLAQDEIAEVTVTAGKNVTGDFKQKQIVGGKEAKKFTVQLPVANSQAEIDELRNHSVKINSQDAKPSLMA